MKKIKSSRRVTVRRSSGISSPKKGPGRGEARQMASANDVAKFILREAGEMTCLKLQKLLYYSQAWSLVWDDEPIFHERIEAWANGPVVPDIYNQHAGKYQVSTWPSGRIGELTDDNIETIRAVLGFYGQKSGFELSQITHFEDPWKDAREGLAPGQRGNRVITHSAMAEYYSALV